MKAHLTYEDRLDIQKGLKDSLKFTPIGDRIGKSRTTVMREVLNRRTFQELPNQNCCLHRMTCKHHYCLADCVKRDSTYCKLSCTDCRSRCPDFTEVTCEKLAKPPYVCNGCNDRRCGYRRVLYDAKLAQSRYEHKLVESRTGISLSEEELAAINELVSPLIDQGLSVPVIYAEHKDELPICEKTLYSYIDAGLLDSRNIDLRRKVVRKNRDKSGPELRVDKQCHIGRTYEDFEAFMDEHADQSVVEMDSVIGRKGGKVLLTLHFLNCDLQLAYIRDKNSAVTVTDTFRMLRDTLGAENFARLFPVILTDRGTEFTDPTKIEADTETGEIQTRLFYCDPQDINQKSNCERNHEFIRYISPKGVSMDHLTQEDITKMMNNINSYPRKKWNQQAPVDLFKQIYGQEIADLLQLQKIPTDSIILKPALLKQ